MDRGTRHITLHQKPRNIGPTSQKPARGRRQANRAHVRDSFPTAPSFANVPVVVPAVVAVLVSSRSMIRPEIPSPPPTTGNPYADSWWKSRLWNATRKVPSGTSTTSGTVATLAKSNQSDQRVSEGQPWPIAPSLKLLLATGLVALAVEQFLSNPESRSPSSPHGEDT